MSLIDRPYDDQAPRIRGAENAPPGLTWGDAYVWARINLGYPVARADRHVVESLRERGLLPPGRRPHDLDGGPL